MEMDETTTDKDTYHQCGYHSRLPNPQCNYCSGAIITYSSWIIREEGHDYDQGVNDDNPNYHHHHNEDDSLGWRKPTRRRIIPQQEPEVAPGETIHPLEDVESSSCSSSIYGILLSLSTFRTRTRTRRRIRTRLRWDNSIPLLLLFILGVWTTHLIPVSYACSSRSTPKPRPPSPTLRPNITIQTYTCPPEYDAHYCLNGATCFTVKIGESILYNCECAEGYMGQRCEFKDLDGSYLPSKQRAMLEQAGVSAGVAIIIVLIVIVLGYIYVKRGRRIKTKQIVMSLRDDGDQVDSRGRSCSFIVERTPFSPYYYNNPNLSIISSHHHHHQSQQSQQSHHHQTANKQKKKGSALKPPDPPQDQ